MSPVKRRRRSEYLDMPETEQLKRTEHLDQADAIVTRAEAESRGLTKSEQVEVRNHLEAADRLRSSSYSVPDSQRMVSTPPPSDWASHGPLARSGSRLGDEGAAILREARTMGVSTLDVGGSLDQASFVGEFISTLRASSVAFRSGVRDIQTDRTTVRLPKMSSDPVAEWTAENAQLTSSDPATGEVILSAKKVGSFVRISNELFQFAEPGAIDLLFRQGAQSLALAVDLAVFEGTGLQNQPRGLNGRSGISTVSMGTNGAAFADLDPFADAIGTLATNNAQASAIVMHPRSWQALIKVTTDTGTSTKPLLQAHSGSGGQMVTGSIYGVPVFLSSQLSITQTQGSATDASSAYVVQADRIVVSRHGPMRVEVDRSRYFEFDQSAVRFVALVDVGVIHEEAVVQIQGIIP